MRPHSKRLQPRQCIVEAVETEAILRPAQHHFDLIKANIADGCTSTTAIFDEAIGEVPSVFNQSVSKLELADELMRRGSNSQAQKVAADGVEK